MPGFKRVLQAARQSNLKWRYMDNFWPVLEYWCKGQPVAGEGARVLTELNTHGVAITSVDALLGPNSCYSELCATVDRLEQDLVHQIAKARTAANDLSIGEKTYDYQLLGAVPELNLNSIYVRFALQKSILQIVNAYFGMFTVLGYFNIWHTFPTKLEARESQLWHRDRNDRLVVKVFVYLSDVDSGAGPFTYAVGTHSKGRIRQEPGYIHEGDGIRTLDSQMAKVVPPKRWVSGVGPKGTIIFADTHGYHKGGLSRERDRLIYQCMFNSLARYGSDLAGYSLDPEQAFALSGTKIEV